MQRFFSGGVLQRKLTINQPGDAYEQQADRVADAVVRMPDPAASLQRESQIGPAPGVQRCSCGTSGSGQCEECKAKAMGVQRSSAGPSHSNTAPPIVHDVLRSSGQPLDVATRSFMEPRFGQDFSSVRVHTDAKAAESARAVNAMAYTVGRDVVFGEGNYRPGNGLGRKLLAHELAHVVQQKGAATQNETRGATATLARTPVLQRHTCDRGTAPAMACTDAQGTAQPVGFPVDRFATNSSSVTAAQRVQITTFKTAWDLLGSADDVEVHGYASCDGPADRNLQLSCDRAVAVQNEIVARGVGTTIQTLAHGETNEFGPSLVDNHKVIIKIVPHPPQAVTVPHHIRGAATPAAMTADRIPPRVDTPVTVTFGGTPNPAAPVTLSIDGAGGGNGSVTIDGSATHDFVVAGAQTVNLRGVIQTTPGSGGNLRLMARQRGALLAQSDGFSVSSIPQNMSFTFNSLVTGNKRGILVDLDWQSDSTVKTPDLNQAEHSERIELTGGTGIFAGAANPHTSCYLNSTSAQQDENSEGPLAALHGSGSLTAKQTFIFKDKRTGATDIPMTNSGFLVNWVVAPKPTSGFQITTSRNAAATNALDPNPACPAGRIASNAGTGSVTKLQDV
jgi:outer membrane protein OmpA-like peptidoglycan-associated protein